MGLPNRTFLQLFGRNIFDESRDGLASVPTLIIRDDPFFPCFPPTFVGAGVFYCCKH